jgi:hypothetical protein
MYYYPGQGALQIKSVGKDGIEAEKSVGKYFIYIYIYIKYIGEK